MEQLKHLQMKLKHEEMIHHSYTLIKCNGAIIPYKGRVIRAHKVKIHQPHIEAGVKHNAVELERELNKLLFLSLEHMRIDSRS
jgi:hypothetical protein